MQVRGSQWGWTQSKLSRWILGSFLFLVQSLMWVLERPSKISLCRYLASREGALPALQPLVSGKQRPPWHSPLSPLTQWLWMKAQLCLALSLGCFKPKHRSQELAWGCPEAYGYLSSSEHSSPHSRGHWDIYGGKMETMYATFRLPFSWWFNVVLWYKKKPKRINYHFWVSSDWATGPVG